MKTPKKTLQDVFLVVFKIDPNGATWHTHTHTRRHYRHPHTLVKMTTVLQNIHDVRSNESMVMISFDGVVRENACSNRPTIWASVKDWFANLQEKGAMGTILTYRLDHIIIPMWHERQQEMQR